MFKKVFLILFYLSFILFFFISASILYFFTFCHGTIEDIHWPQSGLKIQSVQFLPWKKLDLRKLSFDQNGLVFQLPSFSLQWSLDSLLSNRILKLEIHGLNIQSLATTQKAIKTNSSIKINYNEIISLVRPFSIEEIYVHQFHLRPQNIKISAFAAIRNNVIDFKDFSLSKDDIELGFNKLKLSLDSMSELQINSFYFNLANQKILTLENLQSKFELNQLIHHQKLGDWSFQKVKIFSLPKADKKSDSKVNPRNDVSETEPSLENFRNQIRQLLPNQFPLSISSLKIDILDMLFIDKSIHELQASIS
ncbi:hypothetical protein MJH12_11235, partial [bacterium]|nr:hypothetical protein [bacterium]